MLKWDQTDLVDVDVTVGGTDLAGVEVGSDRSGLSGRSWQWPLAQETPAIGEGRFSLRRWVWN